MGFLVSALGSLAGGLFGASGASDAAQAQVQAAQIAANTQMNMFNTLNTESAPNRNIGYGADQLLAQVFGVNPGTLTNSTYSSTPNAPTGNAPGSNNSVGSVGMGIPTANNGGGMLSGAGVGPVSNNPTTGTSSIPGTSNSTPTAAGASPNFSGFTNNPGFQFALGLGNQAIGRSQAANGGLYSANTISQQQQYSTGFASQNYNNYISQLMGMAGLGTTANNTTAAAGTSAAQGISNSQTNVGNAAAAGINKSTGDIQGIIGGITGAAQNYLGQQTPSATQIPGASSYSLPAPNSGFGSGGSLGVVDPFANQPVKQ